MIATSEQIHRTLKDFFGFDSFKGEQETVIKSLLEGKDCFVLMPTGGGKSLCYQLPALMMEGTAIVVSPLIALMKNQVDAIRGFVEGNGSVAHFFNSSLNKQQMDEVKEDLLSGKTKILYVAPESLTKPENVAFLRNIRISFYAVDEAHCISEWGHDFRPEYRRIRPIVESLGVAPIIALTATATPKVQSDILKTLGIPDALVFKSSFNRPNLYYEVKDKIDADKDIVRYIRQNPGKSGIVYCLSRRKVEEMAQFLQINGIRALPYHAGLEAKVRAENQDKFLMEDVDVIVATIAFGMGIDKPDIRFVIHYDIPKSVESYYQETGRAGRDGKEGVCITYYSYKDIQKLEKFMKGKPLAEQDITRQLLDEVVSYAESGQCRRKLLLGYFGEDYLKDNCGMCDNCLHPRTIFDGRAEMKLVIRLVLSLKEHFKIEHLAAILAGSETALVKSYNHDKNKYFAAGATHTEKFWAAVMHQGLIAHLLEKEIETYGLIYVTDLGRMFLDDPWPLNMVEDREFSGTGGGDDDEEEAAVSLAALRGGGGDEQLLALLKDLRKDMAHKLGLQPWILFQDPALDDMSIIYPITIEELKNCQGVGEGKAKKFGKPFVELIAKYVEENEISRPSDYVVKTPAGSNRKSKIISQIDRRISFDEVASAMDLSMEELYEEIESIVSSGTKLNLNYYINQEIEPDVTEELMDYFRNEASSDSLEEAISALGNDYTEDEIRLVRLKFLCEVAS